MEYSSKIFSRIGELMQGILPDQSSFLVGGLPSRIFFSEAIASFSEAIADEDRSPGLSTDLPPKARQAVDLFYQTGHPNSIDRRPNLSLRSNIPPGKGLSSSSADILSILDVLDKYWQTGLSDQTLYSIAARVEPTDPCLSDDIVVFKQETGVADQTLTLPALTMIYFDAAPDRQVNTLDVRRSYDPSAPGFFQSLLHTFLRSAATADYAGLFDCITKSALCNQSIIPLPRFAEFYQLATDRGAGLMVAHSGTIMGLLVRPEETSALLPVVEDMANRYRPTPVHIEQYHSPGN